MYDCIHMNIEIEQLSTMDMEYQSVRLTDLPDEILLYIFRKLDNIDLLYSLIDLNSRIDNVLNESIFTNILSFIRFLPGRSVHHEPVAVYYAYPLPGRILDRFCVHIVPKIYDKVRWLDLESSSMERILLAATYPNLVGITLFNIQIDEALQRLQDERLFPPIYKNQMLSLTIDTNTNGKAGSQLTVNAHGEPISIPKAHGNLFAHIISSFPNLQSFHFGPSVIFSYQYLSFYHSHRHVISSTLSELHVCLNNFDDCLYLLDGRFNQLRLLHINIFFISPSGLTINNKEELPNLKSFTLHCYASTKCYDELVVPLLHRMVNLERLNLSISILNEKPFVDGHHLTVNIINHLPSLNKFTFNICSTSRFYNENNNTPSNEFIRETFKNFPNKQIISCVDYFPEGEYGRCHFYSHPYPCQLRNYDEISNSFPGGIFPWVRRVSLRDERPFEHEFLLRISQSFPFLERLTIMNTKAQKKKQFRKLPNQNEDLPILEYPYLVTLDLRHAHQDYYAQFLFDDRSCLPNGISVYMDYRLAKKVTCKFTSNAAQKNCAKISCVHFLNKSKCPDHIKDYFPRVYDVDYLLK